MRIRTVGAWVAFSAFGAAILHAQIAPPVTQLGLSGSNLQSAVVRGDGTPTNVLVPVSNPPTSDDLFDILTSDAATRISVLLPNGTEIIPADGTSASGLTFVVYTVPDDASDDALSTLLIPGRHVVVQFSSAAAGGQYTVKAIGSGNDSGLTVIYTPSSGPSVAAITDSSSYRLGDMVILSALVFNGTTPVTQASVQATIGGLLPVQGTIGNYQLKNQLQISSTMTRYSYTAQLTADAAASSVIATASNSEPQSKLVADTIWFGDVPASAPVTSQTFFTIERPTAEPFDPSTLQWRISSVATPTTFTLLDSGTYDVAPGDGIFTGTFTPPAVGDYTAFVTVSFGTAPSDRTASTTFHVTPLRARFASFRENVSYAADNSIAQVVSLATLNVSQPATYRYDLQLTASNGSVVRATGQADLIAGTQDIAVQFTPDQLRSLGVDGPWERIQARLTYSPAADAEFSF